VPDRHHLPEPQVRDKVRESLRVGQHRIRPVGLIALAMPPQVDRHDPVPPGEVRCLRSEG
jgi:hypothetical protein